MSANSGPGYRKNPGHRIETAPARGRVRVIFDGEVIADTVTAIRLDESGYAPVYYVPRRDVDMARLARTSHHTHCPFKGDASYFTLSSRNGRVVSDAVWSYEAPYDEVMSISEHLAFYPNKVDSITFTAASEEAAAGAFRP